MTKFIKISTDQDELLLINVAHIVSIKKQDRGASIILSDSGEIKTQQNLEELEELLKN